MREHLTNFTTVGIIIKRISRAPIYHTRWQHRALYNNTNYTHTHTNARAPPSPPLSFIFMRSHG